MHIIGFRLPSNTPGPQRHTSCGWVAMVDNKEVGWCNMSFLPNNVLKFEDAFVLPEYRGKGIYSKLWDTRWNYISSFCKGMKIISYCKPSTYEFYKKKGFEEKYHVTLMEKQI